MIVLFNLPILIQATETATSRKSVIVTNPARTAPMAKNVKVTYNFKFA